MQQDPADEVARKGARFKSDFGQRFLERPFCFVWPFFPPSRSSARFSIAHRDRDNGLRAHHCELPVHHSDLM